MDGISTDVNPGESLSEASADTGYYNQNDGQPLDQGTVDYLIKEFGAEKIKRDYGSRPCTRLSI